MTGKISRRTALLMLSAVTTAPALSTAFAKGMEGKKFVFVILRGAMDGMSALIPDDREVEGLRGNILPSEAERLDLGNGFRLHPSLVGLRSLYSSGEAAFVHAAATGFRERSHFDGQDFLETLGPVGTKDGWLNRALGPMGGSAIAVGYTLPLVLAGAAPASNWSPPVFNEASDDLLDRLTDLYAADERFAGALAQARMTDPGDVGMGRLRGGAAAQYRISLEALGRLMAEDGGPGVGVVGLDGWDTHANQAGQLANRLQGLDEGLAALKAALGNQWKDTCVVMCSEFGRTARANGTRGTDHGTGGLVFLAGGAIAGGKVHGDWPGLKDSALYEGRDLAPANDISGVLKGVLRDHLGVDRGDLDRKVFPGSGRAIDGLIA